MSNFAGMEKTYTVKRQLIVSMWQHKNMSKNRN